MRLPLLGLIAILSVLSRASAQDAGALAAQQAIQAAQQANTQAIAANQQAAAAAQQANQQASQQAMQDMQTASQNAQQACTACGRTAAPNFSLQPGSYPASTVIRLKTRTRGARIFYTTDGWTPTVQSTPYTGPIPLVGKMLIQAIAIAPLAVRSMVASAQFDAPPAPAPVPGPVQLSPTQVELPQNTPIPLVFTSAVTSQKALVGDEVPLALAQDLVVNGSVIAAKGTPAEGRVLAVDPAGRASLPGTLTFSVVSIRIAGVDVALAGIHTREGASHYGRLGLVLIPVVGAATLLKHGDPAEIAANTGVTALVANNTNIPLTPLTASQP